MSDISSTDTIKNAEGDIFHLGEKVFILAKDDIVRSCEIINIYHSEAKVTVRLCEKPWNVPHYGI